MLEQVKEFHDKFECYTASEVGFPSKDIRNLRKGLITEEFHEYIAAEAYSDFEEVADALCDIIYVVLGTALAYGLPIEELYDEVHRSNMSKLDEKGKVVKRADGKVVKSSLFKRPDIVGILDRHKLRKAA